MGHAFYTSDVQFFQNYLDRQFEDTGFRAEVINPSYEELTIRLYNSAEVHLCGQNKLLACDPLDTFISCNLWVYNTYTNQGIAQKIMRAKVAWCELMGYNLLARVTNNNEAQKHILTKYNWIKLGRDYWQYIPERYR